MKHLFVYILCAIMCCGAYAQSNVPVSPPAGVKLKTAKAAEARLSGKFGKPGMLQKREKAAQALRSDDGKLRAARMRVGKPKFVAAPKAQASAPVADDMTRITVTVESDWGDGSGYQLLMDADCQLFSYETIDEMFGASEYVLPENAATMENWLVAGQTATIDIPAGKYDYVVFNPTPSAYSYYIAGGESQGQAYEFKGGCEYTFTISLGGMGDNVELTSDAPVSIGVSGITAPVSAEGLTAAEAVTATIFNNGSEAVSSFDATLTVDGGTPVTETVNHELQPGDTYDYTFNATADLSAPGTHTVTVSISNDDDALTGDNTVTVKVNNIAPIEPPYTCRFDEPADVDEWTVIDANNDNNTWEIKTDDGYAQTTYNSELPSDDYLVTLNPVLLGAGTNKIVIDYNALGDGYYEKFEVLYGKTADVDEMTVLASVADFTMAADGYTLPVNVDIDEDGAYYFAIHATSEPNQMGIVVTGVEISEGAYIGSPDLTVDKVVLPLSSCSLGSGETVGAVISNKGTAAAAGFTVECLVNGETLAAIPMTTTVSAGESVTVDISSQLDLSAEGKYTVGVRITEVTPADGQNEETVTDNNYAEAIVTHYTPADVPFSVDFADPDQRGDWASDDSWLYDDEYYSAMYCTGPSPLVSRGINLEAGKRYRLSYNYMAGMYYYFYVVYDSYDIVLGKDGAPFSEWDILKSFTDVYTNDVFADNDFTFTVPEDGVYSLGFYQEEPQGTFMLSSVSVTEVEAYDASLAGLTGMPSQLPMSQAAGMELQVPVKNNGAENISGTVSVTFNGNSVGSATFADIAPDVTLTVGVPVSAQGLATGDVSVEIEVAIDGHEDSNPADNTYTADMKITDEVYAYDRTTEDMYSPEMAIGVGDNEAGTAGIPFYFYSPATLKGVSVGWGWCDGQEIGISVYKWNPDDIYEPGVINLGEEVFTTTAEQGTETGQTDYLFDEPVTLDPGYYFIGVTFTGYVLTVDNFVPGQLYLVDTSMGTPLAVDQSMANLGTPAIRAIIGDGGQTGIGTVDAAAGASAITYDEATETLTATSASGSSVSLTVYSASGATAGSESSADGRCVFDASRLAPGVYVAKMTSADGTQTSKFVVK